MEAALADAGFDIVHRFDAASVSRELGLDLSPGSLGILIGNTRALWPIFVARADLAVADPLDRYTEHAIEAVAPGMRCFFAHRRYDGAYLPFQRIAVAAGLGTRSPTELVIHPVYGPWFGLRALLVGTGAPPPQQLPLPPVCRCEAACHDAMTRAVAAQGPDSWRSWLAVRDACAVGRTYRYGEDQLVYHYTKRMLGRAV